MLQRTLRQPVIVSAVRTPVGKFQGALSSFSATELGARVVAEVVHRAGIQPDAVDEAIMGNVVQAGLGQNPARQAALRGGLNPRVAAMTINKVCGSGLKAVALAAQRIRREEIDIAVAGAWSRCPTALICCPTRATVFASGIARCRFDDSRRIFGRSTKTCTWASPPNWWPKRSRARNKRNSLSKATCAPCRP